jgi:hypothetical protein
MKLVEQAVRPLSLLVCQRIVERRGDERGRETMTEGDRGRVERERGRERERESLQ